MNIAKYIDHTALKAQTTLKEIETLCEEAKKYDFASVCINPCFVSASTKLLKGSDVKVCTVIGFPLGATSKESKAFEASQAVKDGANEVDMVLNVSQYLSGNFEFVLEDVKAVVNAVPNDVCVKVILETCYLNLDQVKHASQICMEAGADFVKTSTGFGTGGATVEDVKAMKEVVGNKLEVKASGGVRSLETAKQMIEAGATRLGTSSGVEIMNGLESNKGY